MATSGKKGTQRRAIRLRYSVPQSYLELARCVFTSLHHPSGSVQRFVARHGRSRFASAVFALTSLTIIYSYLAIEAFVNYQLYQIWKKRETDDPAGTHFKKRFGDIPKFEDLRRTRLRELPERIKALCDFLGYEQIHNRQPQLWQDFKTLVEKARHFLVHPFPDLERVQQLFSQTLTKTPGGLYVRVAEEVIQHFHTEGHVTSPSWLRENQLIRFRGVELLTKRRRSPANKRLERTSGVSVTAGRSATRL